MNNNTLLLKSKKNKKINRGVATNQKGIIFARSNNEFSVFASQGIGKRKFGIMAR